MLLGNLGPMVLLGMRRLLSEGDVEIVGDALTPEAITPEARRLQPDIVVLDLDESDSQQLSELVRTACPRTKVVLWASAEDVMEVIDPGAAGPRWVLSGVPDDLLAEICTVQVTRAEE